MSDPSMVDAQQGAWPSFTQGEGQYKINNIYDVAPSFLGDLSAWFTMNPFPVPIEQVTGYGNTARQITDSGELKASQATISFTGIPGNYFGLAIRYLARSDAAQLTDRLRIVFNGDNGPNYHATVATRQNITWATVVNNHGLTQMPISQIAAATSVQPGNCGSGVIEIPGYTSTVFTTAVSCRGTVELDSTQDAQLFDVLGTGNWTGTAAITQIDLTCNNGNFVAGSRAVLYGF
jgi:hypothetical protein